ncbi:MAG TPA: M20/M25/M40 family metallo-hydrolase [Bryobacteraceae bacterium]
MTNVFSMGYIGSGEFNLRRFAVILLVFTTLAVAAEETTDLSIVNRIKAEAFQNSQVMDHLFYLSDVYGPRLTNSPGYRAAADWVMERLREYGLRNVKAEKWGPFGQSWKLTRFSGHMLAPQYQPLIGMPLAWTASTKGVVSGEPVLAPLRSEADFERFKGQLRGKIVLIMDAKNIEMSTAPLAHRFTDEELFSRAKAPDPSRLGPAAPAARAQREAAAAFRKKRNQFLRDEGALVVLQYSSKGDGGTVFAQAGGSREVEDPIPPPTVALTPEHYNRIARLIAHQIPVKLEFDVESEMITDQSDSFNVVGEIPGHGKKDELVMLGGHLDSWHGATGATDNGTGCAVAIEAVRILEALHVPLDRTVRIALWGGEEQGLLGSKAYVQEHFARRDKMQLGPEYNKLSAYYNDDNGTGRFRGIAVGGNDMAKPIFEKWLAPFHDLGATAITGETAAPTREPGGTDFTSFTWIGLPGFGFLQDPIEYDTRTHHSNMDFYDRVQPGDLMQAAAIEAWFVYNTAMRKDMMPRIPMPKAEK